MYYEEEDGRGSKVLVKRVHLDLLFSRRSRRIADQVRARLEGESERDLEKLVEKHGIRKVDLLRVQRLDSAKGVNRREEEEWDAKMEVARLTNLSLQESVAKDSSLARTRGKEGQFLTSRYKQL
jgi:hypothetical protein